MVDSIDPDGIQNKANELMPISDINSTRHELTQVMHQLMGEVTVCHATQRFAVDYVTRSGFDQTIDELVKIFCWQWFLRKPKSVAKSSLSFETWIEENKDEIIARDVITTSQT